MIRLPIALPAVVASSAPARPADPCAPIGLSGARYPEWSKNAVLYQLNTRQFLGKTLAPQAHGLGPPSPVKGGSGIS